MEEQQAIVDFVDTKCLSMGDEIDKLIEKLKREIALLGQYKNQMSADIITGRSDLSLIASYDQTLEHDDIETLDDEEV